MKTASVAALKNGLSSYLRVVQTGEEVLVTNRGETIAKLVPCVTEETLSDRERRLVKEGKMIMPTGKYDPAALFRLPIAKGKGSMVKTLLDDREDGI